MAKTSKTSGDDVATVIEESLAASEEKLQIAMSGESACHAYAIALDRVTEALQCVRSHHSDTQDSQPETE